MYDFVHIFFLFLHYFGVCFRTGPRFFLQTKIKKKEFQKVLIVRFSDFISIELDRGQPRLLIDFGSGTLELKVKTKKSLDDGEWHKIDVFWDTEVRV